MQYLNFTLLEIYEAGTFVKLNILQCIHQSHVIRETLKGAKEVQTSYSHPESPYQI